MGDPITKTRLESFLGTVRSYLPSFTTGSFIWTPFVPIITLFGTLKTGPNCLRLPKPIFCGGKIFEEGNFFDENYKLPAFPNEKIQDAGLIFTHNGVLVAPPSIL